MAKEKETKSKEKAKSNIRALLTPRVVLILLAVLLVLIAVIAGAVAIGNYRNNGARYAKDLAEQIGAGIQDAQKKAHLSLQNTSEYACINMIATDYDALYESGKTVEVSGVSIPQWMIFTENNGNSLKKVTFYDYRQLEKYGNGVKTKANIAKEGITSGMTPEDVQKYIGFGPLCTEYTSVTEMTEHYKYYFKDKNSGDTVSYILSINYSNGTATSIKEEENYFILDVLTLD